MLIPKSVKLIAILLSLVLAAQLLLSASFALEEGDAPEPVEVLTDCIEEEPCVGSRALTDAYLRGEGEQINYFHPDEPLTELPRRYDSRDYGWVTPVRKQSPYKTCWSFAAISAIETYMIKHGVIDAETGSPATTELDLSELHAAWFTYTDAYDKLGMLNGDSTTIVMDRDFLHAGGRAHSVSLPFMRWEGPASEQTPALDYDNAVDALENGLNPNYAYDFDVVHLEGFEQIPTVNRDAVKRAIMEYGSACVEYYHKYSLLNPDTAAYCFKQTAEPGSDGYKTYDHVVAIIGWDDDFPASSFKPEYGPSQNGAWIVKNSWGADYSGFDNGYMYLSYEDTVSLNGYCCFYRVGAADNYDNNYQYDGTCGQYYESPVNFNSIANLFTANGEELLRAAAISIVDEAVSYQLSIYLNPSDPSIPVSGTLAARQSGYFAFPGYYTIPLETPVPLSAGDIFAVVFTLNIPDNPNAETTRVKVRVDRNNSNEYLAYTHADRGTTSVLLSYKCEWIDCPYNGDFRIKAYTDSADGQITALSTDPALGTVSVEGGTLVCAPAEGCFVADWEVSSGSADLEQIGENAWHVRAYRDSTIQVRFAREMPYSVNLMVHGAPQGSLSATGGDTVALPAEVSGTPEGWRFIGWTDQPLSETTEKPAYWEPGAAYPVTEDRTLFALFVREESGGEPYYELVREELEDWTGTYAVTGGYELLVLKGLSSDVDDSPEDISIPMADTGIVREGFDLRNVADSYLFRIEKTALGYSIQNIETGAYVGTESNTLCGLSTCEPRFADWTISYNANRDYMRIKNVASTSKPYLIRLDGVFCVHSGNDSYRTRLWREVCPVCLHYSTAPGTEQEAEPIETSDLQLYSSISVGTDMVVTYSARKQDLTDEYVRFWIEVVKHAPEGDVVYSYGAGQPEALNEGNTAWSADFKHIFAKEMGVNIEARLYAQDASGQIYMSPAKTTNIRDYLGGRLVATNNTVEQRVLAADMLNYGAAAQMYMNYETGHLVNQELTAAQLAKLDQYETKTLPAVNKTNSNYRPEGQSNVLFNSVSLDNEVILTLIVRASQGDTVKILMKDHDSGVVLETLNAEWNGSNFSVDYTGIGADKMRVAYDFTAVVNEAETGNTRTWSVEGYVGEIRGGNNQTQINVANALLTYGDSAAAYFAAQ